MTVVATASNGDIGISSCVIPEFGGGVDSPQIAIGTTNLRVNIYCHSTLEYIQIRLLTDKLTSAVTIANVALYEGKYTIDTLPEYQPKGYKVEALNCGALTPKDITVTIPATAWYPVGAGYECSVAANGVLASDNPVMDVNLQGEGASFVDGNIAICEEYSKIFRCMTYNGIVYFQATDVPSVDLPIRLKVVR